MKMDAPPTNSYIFVGTRVMGAPTAMKTARIDRSHPYYTDDTLHKRLSGLKRLPLTVTSLSFT